MHLFQTCQIYSTTTMESLNTSLSILHRPHLQPFPHQRRRPHPIMTLRSNPETQSSNSTSRPQKARPISSNPRFLNNRSDTHLSKNPSGGVSVGKDEVGVGRNGGRGSTMEAIVEKLKKFGYVDRKTDILEGNSTDVASESALGFKKDEVVRFPWEKAVMEEEEEEERRKKSARSWSRTSLAELTLPEGELRRLRNLALRTKERTRGKKQTNQFNRSFHVREKKRDFSSDILPSFEAKLLLQIPFSSPTTTTTLIDSFHSLSLSLSLTISASIPCMPSPSHVSLSPFLF